ncbi:hypothetical protein GCM10027511_30170 [Hymenobacter humi]
MEISAQNRKSRLLLGGDTSSPVEQVAGDRAVNRLHEGDGGGRLWSVSAEEEGDDDLSGSLEDQQPHRDQSAR